MFRTRVCSGLIGAGLAMAAAVAQQPPAPREQKGQPPAQAKPAAESLEAMIAAAQRNHPDVRMAEAKLHVAEAELAQAKLQVAQRVAVAHAKIELARARVGNAERGLHAIQRAPAAVRVEMPAKEQELAAAKAALSEAEIELRSAQGLLPGQSASAQAEAKATFLDATLQLQQHQSTAAAIAFLAAQQFAKPPAPGTAADKLRGLVEKRVALDLKQAPFEEVMTAFIQQTGLSDVTVRYPEWANNRFLQKPPMVGPLKGEQTVAGWLQLILDDFNRSLVMVGAPPGFAGKHEVYVRDYGLLVTRADLAPPGAVTLADFARQVKTQADLDKAVRDKAGPEPKK